MPAVLSLTLVLVTTCQLGLVAWYAPTTLEGASLPLLEEEFHTKVTREMRVK